MLINKALIKYGYANFSLEIIEYCDRSDAILREQFYLDLFKPEYNLLKDTGLSLGYVITENTLAKIRDSRLNWTEEQKAKILDYLKIHDSSAEQREKSGLRLTEYNKSKGMSIEILDTTTKEVLSYFSIRQAAEALGCVHGTILLAEKSKKEGISKLIKKRYLVKTIRREFHFYTRSSTQVISNKVWTSGDMGDGCCTGGSLNIKLNPLFITGLTDGEGCFSDPRRGKGVMKDNKYKTGWRVLPVFTIHMSGEDKDLLYKVQSYFGVGTIRINKKTASVHYSVSSVKDLISVIIPHFIKYPLRSAKSVDFKLWEQCIELILNKKHLTIDGLNKIISFKSALNLGLSDNLKTAFPYIQHMKRPAYIISNDSLDPDWISGIMEGESCFIASIRNRATVALQFVLCMNIRELPLLVKIQEYFGVGQISNNIKHNAVYWRISNVNHLVEKVLSQFEQFPLQGYKAHNYLIWSKILLKVKAKQHLTNEGLTQIKLLKSKLNWSSVVDELDGQ